MSRLVLAVLSARSDLRSRIRVVWFNSKEDSLNWQTSCRLLHRMWLSASPYLGRILLACFLVTLSLATNSSAQVSGGATVSGSASLNAACTPVCTSGLLVPSANNTLLKDQSGKTIVLTGSQTWTTFQDLGNAGATTAFDFTTYINMLKSHGHNATILWRKDLPQFCGWGAGGTWLVSDAGFPWVRSATPGASDGGNKWDLTTFNAAHFSRMRTRALQLYLNNIYAVVQLFDGLQLNGNRCGTTPPTGDGYPLTGINNINGVSDGYTSGTTGNASMNNGVPNAMTVVQVAYMQKMVDTLNDLPNVIWEVSEESGSGAGPWNTYMISQLQAYEATKPFQHPVLYPTLQSGSSDSPLYNSNATVVAPTAKVPAVASNCGTGTPACKVVINDSDHSYFGMWNDSAQTNRQYAWENFTNGFNVLFMDPGLIFAGPSNATWLNRNLCDSGVAPAHGVCSVYDTRWNNFRDNLGAIASYGNTKLNLQLATPQPAKCSTGFCLVNNSATTGQFLIYAPSGGGFTVNLLAQAGRSMVGEWFDPANLTTTSINPVAGGNTAQSFTPPWGSARDAILYLTDGGPSGGSAGLFPNIGWTQMSGTNFATVVSTYPEIIGAETGRAGIFTPWSGALFDVSRKRLCVQGGGHTDDYGNDVTCVDLSTTPASSYVLKDATHNPNLGSIFSNPSPESEAIATPNARHHYDGFIWDSHVDTYWLDGTFLSTAANGTDRVWTLNPRTLTLNGNDPTGWSLLPQSASHPAHATNGSVSHFAFVPGNETIQPFIFEIEQNVGTAWQFNDVTNTWASVASTGANACTNNTNMTTAVDTVNRVYYCIGQGKFYAVLVDSPFTTTNLSTAAGCSALISGNAPGFDYYASMRTFVGYNGGTTVYTYTPGNPGSCATQTISGGPTTVQTPNGTYKKFSFDSADGVFVSCNSLTEDCFALRLDSNATQMAADWTARSTAAGVVRAENFSNTALFSNHVATNVNGAHASPNNGNLPIQDCTTSTSNSGCSARMTVPAQTGPNASGEFYVLFGPDGAEQHFAQNTTFYMQMHYKVSSEVAGQHPTGTYRKDFVVAVPGNTCQGEELTQIDYVGNGYPGMYTHCGAPTFQVPLSGAFSSDLLNEQGDNCLSSYGTSQCSAPVDTGWNCHFVTANNTSTSCFNYPMNTWITFYCKFQIGTFNTNTSSTNCWEALPGQPYKQYEKFLNFPISFSAPAGDSGFFSFVDLVAYYTARSGGTAYGQSGFVWYGDVIVSTNPISPPMGPVN